MFYLLGAGAVALGAFFVIRKVLGPNKKNRKRALSFSSEILIRGAFPPKSKVWQPNINAVFYMKKCPSIEKCVGKCHSLLYYDRFRSSFVQLSNGTWDFVDLKDSINPEKDLIETFEFNSLDEMHAKMDLLNHEDIDHCGGTKPVWKLYRFINKNGDSAVYFRLHHALGDGIALLGTMRKMFEDSNGDPVRFEMAEKMGGGVNRKVGLKTIWKFVVSFFEVLALASSSYDSDIKFTDPDKPNMVMTDKRKTLYFPVLNLDFVKDVKNHAKVSVNDVLMSAMSGAIRRYSEMKNDALVTQSKKRLLSRALLPVAFPRPVKDTSTPNKSLRNLWSFVSAPLPINGKTAQDRLMICAKATKRLKSSPQALVQLLLQNNLVANLPEFLCRKITQDVFSRHSMVFSNLPGPTNPMFFAEERVLGLQVIFPNLIPQVLIVSYANGVFCNMSVDPDLVDECDKLPQLFLDELAEVAKSYGVNADPAYMVQPRPVAN